MLDKNQIINNLKHAHQHFLEHISSLSAAELEWQQAGKWSAAQQVAHIFKSVNPLAKGLILPKFMIKLIWGKANRKSKSYPELVEKYLSKLEQGGRASSPFIPKMITAAAVPVWKDKIMHAINTLTKRLQKFSESDLDLFILPHPLLGKVTMREMMYFTIYHVQHHEEIIKNEIQKQFSLS